MVRYLTIEFKKARYEKKKAAYDKFERQRSRVRKVLINSEIREHQNKKFWKLVVHSKESQGM